jgi:hypothetical protein
MTPRPPADSSTRAPTRTVVLAGVVAVVVSLAILGSPAGATAASPSPTEPPVGDTRSSGEGAGFVGQPLLAVGAVILVGLLAAGATLAYVRLTDRRR